MAYIVDEKFEIELKKGFRHDENMATIRVKIFERGEEDDDGELMSISWDYYSIAERDISFQKYDSQEGAEGIYKDVFVKMLKWLNGD